ncbi:lipid phosphate phosphatase 2-like protein [Tanacetum coccineum]
MKEVVRRMEATPASRDLHVKELSHGRRVARIHMHDWLILILLAVIEVGLNVLHPFYCFVGKDMMADLKYPLKENTVPIYAVILPIVVFLFIYIRRRDVHDLHHAILGLLFSNYDHWGNIICTGKDSLIRDGHKSFPSGHTSLSFTGLIFLALYLAGKIEVFDRRGHVAKLCVIFLPLLMASLVAVSRVDDYRHHWQDVSVGGLLGLFQYLSAANNRLDWVVVVGI